MESRINAFATSCYQIILSIRRTDHVPNTTIYAMTMMTPLCNCVKSRHLRFLGHILRLPDEEPARLYALYTPPHGRRKAGRPRTLYLTYIQRLLGDHEDMLQEQRSPCMEKTCGRLRCSRTMMMMVMMMMRRRRRRRKWHSNTDQVQTVNLLFINGNSSYLYKSYFRWWTQDWLFYVIQIWHWILTGYISHFPDNANQKAHVL